MTTRFSKTRQPKRYHRGENHYKSRFSNEQVQILRAIYHNTHFTLGALAKMFDVTRSCIHGIVTYATYKHVRDLDWTHMRVSIAIDGKVQHFLYVGGKNNRFTRAHKPKLVNESL